LENELWQFKAIREMGIELKEECFEMIADIIAQAVDNDALRKARHEAKGVAWQHRGEAGKLIADFMLSETA
jgi:hypothetical protein